MVSEYLKSLGDTPDAVAASLRTQGVKGRRASRSHCPLINGVYKYCKTWPGLKAYGGRLTFDDSQIIDPVCPAACSDFMQLFDEGQYTELEELGVANEN